MQNKRAKRSRSRAAKRTAGYGSKKKHRGSGHRGGFGLSNIGKRGSGKLMKITKGKTQQEYLGKHGFKSREEKVITINIQQIQDKLDNFLDDGKIVKEGSVYKIDLSKMGIEKLLAKGDVKIKLHVTVDSATENAISKIEAAGGKVETLEKASAEN